MLKATRPFIDLCVADLKLFCKVHHITSSNDSKQNVLTPRKVQSNEYSTQSNVQEDYRLKEALFNKI